MYSSVKNPAAREVNLIDFDSEVAAAQTYDNNAHRDLYDNTGKDPNLFGDVRGAGTMYDNPLAQGMSLFIMHQSTKSGGIYLYKNT